MQAHAERLSPPFLEARLTLAADKRKQSGGFMPNVSAFQRMHKKDL